MDNLAKVFNAKINTARMNMNRVIVGNDEAIALTLACLIVGRPMLLTSLRGRGKTALARAFQEMIIGAAKARLQGTPELMPGDITGREIFDEKVREFRAKLSKAMVANVTLFDEINRMLEEAQAALMELLEEGQATIGEETFYLPKVALWICTRNPDGQAGTYKLADPTRDRLLLDVDMKFPKRKELTALARNTKLFRNEGHPEAVFEIDEIVKMREYNDYMVEKAPEPVLDYAAALTEVMQVDEKAFRKLELTPSTDRQAQVWKDLDTRNIYDLNVLVDGLSTRAYLGLVHAAAAVAFIEGHDTMRFEDVDRVWIPAGRHKLVMSPVARALEILPEDILKAAKNSLNGKY